MRADNVNSVAALFQMKLCQRQYNERIGPDFLCPPLPRPDLRYYTKLKAR